MIDLSDAIDVREVKNYTLANQLLKIKKKRKEQADKRKNAENIQMQSQANQQAAQKASEGRMQESQLKTQSESELMQLKAQLELQKLEAEKQKDVELMQIKYEYEMKIKGMESKGLKDRETNREDRKDQRTELQATQQSELITQRKQGGPPKNFSKPKGNKLDMLKASGGGILGGSPSPTATAMPMQPPQQRETQAMPQMQPPTGQGAPPAQDEAMMNALMSKMQGGKNV